MLLLCLHTFAKGADSIWWKLRGVPILTISSKVGNVTKAEILGCRMPLHRSLGVGPWLTSSLHIIRLYSFSLPPYLFIPFPKFSSASSLLAVGHQMDVQLNLYLVCPYVFWWISQRLPLRTSEPQASITLASERSPTFCSSFSIYSTVSSSLRKRIQQSSPPWGDTRHYLLMT